MHINLTIEWTNNCILYVNCGLAEYDVFNCPNGYKPDKIINDFGLNEMPSLLDVEMSTMANSINK